MPGFGVMIAFPTEAGNSLTPMFSLQPRNTSFFSPLASPSVACFLPTFFLLPLVLPLPSVLLFFSWSRNILCNLILLKLQEAMLAWIECGLFTAALLAIENLAQLTMAHTVMYYKFTRRAAQTRSDRS